MSLSHARAFISLTTFTLVLDDVIASYLAEQNAAAQEHNVSVRADFDWV